MPSNMPFLVISLKSTRFTGLFLSIWLAICHAIASPSLSGSGARNTLSAFFAFVLREEITFSLPSITIYLGSKLCSISTPNSLGGRSII